MIFLRMKQTYLLTGISSNKGSIGFESITGGASEAQILKLRLTVQGSGNDMFNFETNNGQGFVGLTISTSTEKMVANVFSQRGRNIFAHEFEPFWL
jgi:hypothetical protein